MGHHKRRKNELQEADEQERRAAKDHLDKKLDEALDETFPASDPIQLTAELD